MDKAVKNLVIAIQEKDFDTAVSFIEGGVDVNVKLTNNLTPVFLVAELASYEVFFRFIELGADILSKTKDKLTPLHYAARGGNLQIVKYLVEHGISVSVASSSGSTPLHYAAEGGNYEVALYFLEKGVKANVATNGGVTPIFHATDGRNLERVTRNFPKTNIKDLEELRDKNLKMVMLLIEHGANIEKTDNRGRTPLYKALESDQVEIVNLLINKGATYDKLIFCAFDSGNLEILQWLLNKGVDPNTKDSSGKTALFYLSRYNQIELADILVTAGANLNVLDKKGRTALSYAVEKINLDPVEFFLDQGDRLNINEVDSSGHTALYYAVRKGYKSTILQLVENGAVCTSDIIEYYKQHKNDDEEILTVLSETMPPQ